MFQQNDDEKMSNIYKRKQMKKKINVRNKSIWYGFTLEYIVCNRYF